MRPLPVAVLRREGLPRHGRGRIEFRLPPPRGELDISTGVGEHADLEVLQRGIGSDPTDQPCAVRGVEELTLDHQQGVVTVPIMA